MKVHTLNIKVTPETWEALGLYGDALTVSHSVAARSFLEASAPQLKLIAEAHKLMVTDPQKAFSNLRDNLTKTNIEAQIVTQEAQMDLEEQIERAKAENRA